MENTEITDLTVAVLGGGTMGRGIGQVMAMAGHQVSIRDVDEDVLENAGETIVSNLDGGVERGKIAHEEKAATLERLSFTTDLRTALTGVDLVVEAVPESMDLKREVFTDAESHVDESTIIATNTSSLSVTAVADALDRPDRAIGMHFFNPVHILPLVEIVVPEQAADETVEFAGAVIAQMDKEPIVVRDSPGFASSRLGVTLAVEAIRMLEAGVASTRDIDRAMTLGYNHPMGPLELTDVVGLDVRLDILEHLREELGERFKPPTLLRQKVRAGHLGKKTGMGFYHWEDGERVEAVGEHQ